MSKLKLDVLYTSDKNLSEYSIGDFCGSPIHEMYTRDIDVDVVVETNRLVEINRKNTSVFVAEILPGELICERDNVIRRETTAEAIGPEFYEYEMPKDSRIVTLAEARKAAASGALVTWRPDRVTSREDEFAIVHEEVACS